MTTSVADVGSTAKRAARSEEIGWLARLGLVAMGVSYGLVAVLAILLALDHGGKATDRQGALQTLAKDGFGRAVVIMLAVGFAAYAVWRVAQAIFDRGGEGTKPKGLAKRAGYLGRALIYAGLCFTAVSVLMGASGSSSEKKEAAWVLDWPAGRLIVAAVGVGFLIAAGWNVVRGLLRKFKKQLDMSSMSETTEKAVSSVALVGLLARGVVFGLIGVFLVKAAWEYDPQEAIGVDGALRKVVAQSHGELLLGVVAAGLLAFAVYCLVQARYRRV